MQTDGFLLFGRTNEIILKQMATNKTLDLRGFTQLLDFVAAVSRLSEKHAKNGIGVKSHYPKTG